MDATPPPYPSKLLPSCGSPRESSSSEPASGPQLSVPSPASTDPPGMGNRAAPCGPPSTHCCTCSGGAVPAGVAAPAASAAGCCPAALLLARRLVARADNDRSEQLRQTLGRLLSGDGALPSSADAAAKALPPSAADAAVGAAAAAMLAASWWMDISMDRWPDKPAPPATPGSKWLCCRAPVCLAPRGAADSVATMPSDASREGGTVGDTDGSGTGELSLAWAVAWPVLCGLRMYMGARQQSQTWAFCTPALPANNHPSQSQSTAHFGGGGAPHALRCCPACCFRRANGPTASR